MLNNKTTTIEYVGDNVWTNFIFGESIPSNSIYEFKIRIIKTTNGNIFIGVVDSPKQRQRSYAFSKSGNAIGYYGYYHLKKKSGEANLFEGSGFS